MIELNELSVVFIFIWSLWCILSSDVNDGIIGKIIFSFTALAAFALTVNPPDSVDNASNALHWSLAAIGLRQMTMRYIWPRFFKRIAPAKRASDI